MYRLAIIAAMAAAEEKYTWWHLLLHSTAVSARRKRQKAERNVRGGSALTQMRYRRENEDNTVLPTNLRPLQVSCDRGRISEQQRHGSTVVCLAQL
mmetsp:Transcript_65844/g.129775  ORF Transcript_65844/g.129775 Transcript_65844/m.129775 type:complete len:96 (+) Transcript_65844:283-570(+)